MPNINYGSLAGGGYQATVDESPGYGGGDGGDYGWMMELARRRADQKLKMGDIQQQMAEWQLRDQRRASLDASSPKLSGQNSYDRQMRELALRDAVAKTNAMTGTAPTKRVSPMGTTGSFDTPDELAMNAYQRQAFLPQGSQFSGEPTPLEQEAMTYGRRRGQGRADEEGIASAASRLAGARPGYFPTSGSIG